MKKITIEIELTNDAFQNGNLALELARIVTELGEDISTKHLPNSLLDLNGNKVGTVKVEY